jgi:hypothetical protein
MTEFDDGSVVSGLSSYARTDGSTGVAGDTTLKYQAWPSFSPRIINDWQLDA